MLSFVALPFEIPLHSLEEGPEKSPRVQIDFILAADTPPCQRSGD